MGLREKLEEKKRKMQEQIQRGRERTEQDRAERLRKRSNKLASMKPGTRRAITEGIALKKSPLDVMHEEYNRRKYEREKKYRNKDEDDSG